MGPKEAISQGLRVFNPKVNPFCGDLPRRQRAVFILYISGFRTQTISELFGIKKRTVTYYISISRRKYPRAEKC